MSKNRIFKMKKKKFKVFFFFFVITTPLKQPISIALNLSLTTRFHLHVTISHFSSICLLQLKKKWGRL